MTDALAAALAAARGNRLHAALDALLVEWADTPAPRIAALIELVSKAIAPPVPGELYGDSPAAIAAWSAMAAARARADLPALLTTLTSVPVKHAAERLAALAWPSDPRLDAAVVSWCVRPPFTGRGSQRWWDILLGRLANVRDRRQLDAIRRLDGTVATTIRSDLGRGIRERLAHVVPELVTALEEPVTTFAIVTELEAALAAIGATPHDGRLDDLLRAVYEQPDDDAARMVYADALLERQDPRGELIQLQLRGGPPSPKEKKLVAGLRKAILGDLARVVSEPGIERGFLARCTVNARTRLDVLRPLAGNPAWATVRDLEGAATIGLHPVMRGLRGYGFNAYTATAIEGIADAPHELLAWRERPLEELRYAGPFPELDGELALLQHCRALPRLRRLLLRVPRRDSDAELVPPGMVDAIPRWVDALAAAPVLDRLEQIAFRVLLPRRLEPFQPMFAAGRARAVAIGLDDVQLVLERGPRTYERATLSVKLPRWNDYQLAGFEMMFATLPATLRAIRIVARRPADRHAADLLRIVAARRPGVEATVEL